MMYSNSMALAVKVKGQVLREFKDTVLIPFGSEYSLLLKNLNTKRALVNVFIDGTNVVPGGLVLNAGQEIDLERSLANGSLNAGNKFKFIERTSQIEQHRGVKLEDGLVRVEYQFEQVYDYSKNWNTIINTTPIWSDVGTWYNDAGPLNSINAVARGAASSVTYTASGSLPQNAILSKGTRSFNDAGITVEGSKSSQKFQHVASFALESTKHSIILKLLGETPDNKPVLKPVTVKQKNKCTTCGTFNKSHAHFCSKCGTSLKIFA